MRVESGFVFWDVGVVFGSKTLKPFVFAGFCNNRLRESLYNQRSLVVEGLGLYRKQGVGGFCKPGLSERGACIVYGELNMAGERLILRSGVAIDYLSLPEALRRALRKSG